MDRHEGDPWIQFIRKVDQVLRVVEQRQDENPEQANEDGHLNDQRPQATDRVDSALAVEPHGFLRDSLTVAFVPLLNFANPWLHRRHGSHLPQLTYGQRYGHHAYDHGERDDGEAHLREAQHVQHQQGVQHGPDDHLIPDEDEYGEKFHLSLPVVAPNLLVP